MHRIAFLLLGLFACGGSHSVETPKTCGTGELLGPLNTCMVNKAAPPCRCSSFTFCCAGDVCAGEGQLTTDGGSCMFGLCLSCQNGVLSCSSGSFLSVSDECKPEEAPSTSSPAAARH